MFFVHVISTFLQNKREILRRLNQNLKAQEDGKERNESKSICEKATADENNQDQEEEYPVLADRKKWEAGTQLVVPLAELTMEESLLATEGKLPLFKPVSTVLCGYIFIYFYHIS